MNVQIYELQNMNYKAVSTKMTIYKSTNHKYELQIYEHELQMYEL